MSDKSVWGSFALLKGLITALMGSWSFGGSCVGLGPANLSPARHNINGVRPHRAATPGGEYGMQKRLIKNKWWLSEGDRGRRERWQLAKRKRR